MEKVKCSSTLRAALVSFAFGCLLGAGDRNVGIAMIVLCGFLAFLDWILYITGNYEPRAEAQRGGNDG